MAQKERYQNPAVGDNINLRLFSYNSNNLANLNEVIQVDIYYLDPTFVNAENQDGRRLIESFPGSAVNAEDIGVYSLQINAEEAKYVIGKYIDVWTVTTSDYQPVSTVYNKFQIYPNLWYTTPIPIVYDFSFRFLPNKLRVGSIQYLIIEIIPNVPTAGDLRQYYENLAIVSDLSISIEQNCGNCLPAEQDLRTIVDNQLIDYREKRYGYYKLDTVNLEMTCGIYDIWFTLEFGGNKYISDRFHFQLYD